MDSHLLVRSPLSYQGSKYKLLRALQQNCAPVKVLHDVFGGSGTVGLNMPIAKTVHINELDPNVYGVLLHLKSRATWQEIVKQLDATIRKHKLGNTREYEDAYYRFRSKFNKSPNWFDLWVLSKHSFSSLIRFNKTSGFDLPFGFRSPQKSKSRDFWIQQFWTRLQSVKLHNKTYLQYVKHAIRKADRSHVFYFDPPYLASGANVYIGEWTEADDQKLRDLLDYMNKIGLRWVLSNVTKHRGHKNKPLAKWMKQYNYSYPAFTGKGELYSLNRAADTKDNGTVEVIIKNF